MARLPIGLVGALLLASVPACAPPIGESSFIKSCVIAEDQMGTFDGRWQQLPIPIATQSGQNFSATEKQAIIDAAEKWNRVSRFSLGVDAFDVGGGTLPEGSIPNAPCQIPNLSGGMSGGVFSPIVIRKRSDWSSTYYSSGVIAVTTTCPTGDPISQVIADARTFYGGQIELNYQQFFVTGSVPDLESIVAHELGHLAGLKHSCEGSTSSADVPRCSSPAINPLYKSALMFPSFGIGEKRSNPNPNDQGRFNCLYLPLFGITE